MQPQLFACRTTKLCLFFFFFCPMVWLAATKFASQASATNCQRLSLSPRWLFASHPAAILNQMDQSFKLADWVGRAVQPGVYECCIARLMKRQTLVCSRRQVVVEQETVPLLSRRRRGGKWARWWNWNGYFLPIGF